jgi:hypothetical protein
MLHREHYTRFDFSIGDYPHKRRLGTEQRPLLELTAALSARGVRRRLRSREASHQEVSGCGGGGTPGDRGRSRQTAVILSRRIRFLLVLGVRLEADAVERQDLSALQERAPAGNQCGLRDVDLLECVRIRSADDESRQLDERSDDRINIVLR